MDCLEFRRTLGADPNHVSPEASAHRAQCAGCEKYAQEMLRLNGLIKRALEVPVRSAPKQKSIATRWYAMAASLVAAVGLAGAVWFLGYSEPSLASAVAKHIEHERSALSPTESRIASELIDGALRAKGMHLAQPMSDVSYVQSCPLRGDFVPHLVVQTPQGAVTVMILPKEPIEQTTRFEENGYRGVLVPMQRGSMAVLANDDATVDSVARKVKSAIAFE